MARTLYLHAGTAKTGTTSLQNWLSGNRAALEGRGILYPAINHSSDQNPMFNRAHHILAFHWGVGWFKEAPEVTLAAWQDLAHQAAEHDGDIIISSETFALALALHGDEMFDFIADLLPNVDIHCIIYLRDHEGLIRSDIFEALRNGQAARSAWRHALEPPWYLRALLDYRNLVRQSLDNPHVKQTTVRAFDPARLTGGSLLADFCAALELPSFESDRPEITANQFNDSAAMYLMLCHISGLKFSKPRLLKRKCYDIATRLGDTSGRFDWSPAFYQFLRDKFAPDRAFLDQLAGGAFFAGPRRASGHTSDGFEDMIARELFKSLTGSWPERMQGYAPLLNDLSELDSAGQLAY